MDIAHINFLHRYSARHQLKRILRRLADNKDGLLRRCLHDYVTGVLDREKAHGDGLWNHCLHQRLLHGILAGRIICNDNRIHAESFNPELSLSVNQPLVNPECHNIRYCHFISSLL